MRKERIAAVEAVRTEFELAEESAEMAAAQGARTIATFIEKRSDLKLPLDFGLDALDAMTDGLRLAVSTRRRFFEAHAELAKLPALMGVEKAFGPACPPNEPFTIFKLELVDGVEAA